MQPNQQHSPTLAAAIDALVKLGFRAGTHFTRDTALELLHDIAAARAMYDALGRTAETAPQQAG